MTAGEIGRVLAAYPGVLPGLALSIAVAYGLRRRIGAWLETTPGLGFAFVLVIGIVLSATLTPSPAALAGGVGGGGTCDLSRVGIAGANQLARLGEIFLNIMLFIPVGVVVALLPPSRHRRVVVIAVLASPVAIELTQLAITSLGRECQSGDTIDNATGLALGAGAALGIRWIVEARRTPRTAAIRLAVVSFVAGGVLASMFLLPGRTAVRQPSAVPTPSIAPPRSTAPDPGTRDTVRVDSITALLDALADDDVSEIVVEDGTYAVTTAAQQAPESLWIGSRFAPRTNPVTVRAETVGGVTFDGGGADYFGGITFVDGAHHQTWDGFVFANGTPTQTGVVVFGGYRGLAAPHHITMRNITIPRSITSAAEGAVDHAFYLAAAVGGPHDLLFEDITVDGGGGLSSAFHIFGSDSENKNAWNVTVRRLQVTGTQQAIILWDSTIHDITFETVTITDALDHAVRFESAGATNITFSDVTSTGSGSGTGFQSGLGPAPPGVSFSNNSFR